MTIYTCKRCAYETHRKCNYRTHLHKKTVCQAEKEDIPIETLRTELDASNDIVHLHTLTCDKCGAMFRSRQGLYKHSKKHNDDGMDEMSKLKDRVDKLTEQVSHIIITYCEKR